MSIKSRLCVMTVALTFSVGFAGHAIDFDPDKNLEEFQSRQQMNALEKLPPAPGTIGQELKDKAIAEKEMNQLKDLENPTTYMSDKALNDEVSAVNLAEHAQFDYAKAETAAHVPQTWWGKFLKFIHWDAIENFLKEHRESAEQWEQVYGNM